MLDVNGARLIACRPTQESESEKMQCVSVCVRVCVCDRHVTRVSTTRPAGLKNVPLCRLMTLLELLFACVCSAHVAESVPSLQGECACVCVCVCLQTVVVSRVP